MWQRLDGMLVGVRILMNRTMTSFVGLKPTHTTTHPSIRAPPYHVAVHSGTRATVYRRVELASQLHVLASLCTRTT